MPLQARREGVIRTGAYAMTIPGHGANPRSLRRSEWPTFERIAKSFDRLLGLLVVISSPDPVA